MTIVPPIMNKIVGTSPNIKKVSKIPKIGNNKYETRGKLDLNIVEPGETNYNLVKVSCDSIDNFVKSNKLKIIHFIKIEIILE